MTALRTMTGLRVLVLLTDSYGGHGGIAKFNRDLLRALATDSRIRAIHVLPRLIQNPYAPAEIPHKVDFVKAAAGSKFRYLLQWLRTFGAQRFDLVWCGHINLLPLAWVSSRRFRAPLVLSVHGIEVWRPVQRRFSRWALKGLDLLVAVSRVSAERMGAWSAHPSTRTAILPNCVDMVRFRAQPRRPDLIARHGLEGKRTLLTVGRLSGQERYKGFDEVLEALPGLLRAFPDLVYLVCGDGDDRERLEAKARALGVADRVVFAGMITEAEKVDYYNLADAYAMPSRGEGFGIVFLEAMACGLPVVGSTLDGSREALVEGKLGILVNPADSTDVERGIRAALGRSRAVPAGLAQFDETHFDGRVGSILDRVLAG